MPWVFNPFTGKLDYTATDSGDMLKATYDPTNINDSAFDVDNHTSGTTNKVFTAVEQTKLAGTSVVYSGTGSPPTAVGKADGTLFFKYT